MITKLDIMDADLKDKKILDLQLKINEIVEWCNEHEDNPPYVRPTIYNGGTE